MTTSALTHDDERVCVTIALFFKKMPTTHKKSVVVESLVQLAENLADTINELRQWRSNGVAEDLTVEEIVTILDETLPAKVDVTEVEDGTKKLSLASHSDQRATQQTVWDF